MLTVQSSQIGTNAPKQPVLKCETRRLSPWVRIKTRSDDEYQKVTQHEHDKKLMSITESRDMAPSLCLMDDEYQKVYSTTYNRKRKSVIQTKKIVISILAKIWQICAKVGLNLANLH